MSGPIENPRPIHLGYDLNGNAVVAHPRPDETLVDFLARAQEMADEVEESHSRKLGEFALLLEQAALQKGREAKEAGIGQDRVDELRQDAIDCRHMAFYLCTQSDVSAALRLLDAMDHSELVLPEAVLEALARGRRMEPLLE